MRYSTTLPLSGFWGDLWETVQNRGTAAIGTGLDIFLGQRGQVPGSVTYPGQYPYYGQTGGISTTTLILLGLGAVLLLRK